MSLYRVETLAKEQQMSARQAIDYGTKERARHDKLVVEGDERAGTTHVRVATQTQLDKYLRAGKLGDDLDENLRLVQVGRRYAELSFAAGIAGNAKIIDLNRVLGVRSDGDHAHVCLQKIRMADNHLGPRHASVVRAVCVDEWSSEAWAKKNGLPSKKAEGSRWLVDSLRLLGRFWGMV